MGAFCLDHNVRRRTKEIAAGPPHRAGALALRDESYLNYGMTS